MFTHRYLASEFAPCTAARPARGAARHRPALVPHPGPAAVRRTAIPRMTRSPQPARSAALAP